MPHPTSLTLPPLLTPGARVALVAPAGPLGGDQDVELAEQQARAFGWAPVASAHARGRHGYFAAPDAERLADLNRAIGDASVDGIWCLRGGYGAMRLLDAIDFDALRRHPKAIIGYSDITAIHAAVNARCDIVSYHGPTARSALSAFSRDSLRRAVVDGVDSCGVARDAQVLRGGVARGRLAGGNLALVTALCGTPYATRLDGAILVLEDVNEPVYRIDRMFQQLLLCGELRRCAAIVLGDFSEMPDGGNDAGRTAVDVFREVADAVGVPCVAGIPMGHIDDQWTLPLGRMAELDADARSLRVL